MNITKTYLLGNKSVDLDNIALLSNFVRRFLEFPQSTLKKVDDFN